MNTQEPERRIKRILVAIDASPHSQAALRAAVDLARQIGSELSGIFVEDENLLRMADLSFTREIRLFSTGVTACTAEDIRRQLRVQARRAEELVTEMSERAGISSSFRVTRGQVVAELLAAAEDNDLITIGRIGHSKAGLKTLGSTAEALLKRASRPIMVLEQGVRLHPPVLVLYDGSKTAVRALEMAGEITRTTEYTPVSVVVLEETREQGKKLEEQALNTLKSYNVPVAFHSTSRLFSHQLIHTIETKGCGIVLSPTSLLDRHPDELRHVMTSIDCPIVFVR